MGVRIQAFVANSSGVQMSRARFFVDRPLAWVVGLVVVAAVGIDAAAGRASAVELVALIVLVGWVTEFLFRAHRDAERREADANARWALAGLMHGGEMWPVMGGWALGPSAAVEWIRRVSVMPSPRIVELGPGTSTILLAHAVPHAEVHAVEHDPEYADRIRTSTAGLAPVVVVHAPLEQSQGGPGWYAPEALAALPDRVDALLVDGPPNWDGKGRRSPARTVIESRMGPGGLILVDDTHRRDERSMVRAWVNSGLCRVLHDGGDHVFLEKC